MNRRNYDILSVETEQNEEDEEEKEEDKEEEEEEKEEEPEGEAPPFLDVKLKGEVTCGRWYAMLLSVSSSRRSWLTPFVRRR